MYTYLCRCSWSCYILYIRLNEGEKNTCLFVLFVCFIILILVFLFLVFASENLTILFQPTSLSINYAYKRKQLVMSTKEIDLQGELSEPSARAEDISTVHTILGHQGKCYYLPNRLLH